MRGAAVLTLLAIFGASLLYGEGLITPAISVLSAVEGLAVGTDAFKHLVLPITLTILIVLFLAQKGGTAGIGRVFGPATPAPRGTRGGEPGARGLLLSA